MRWDVARRCAAVGVSAGLALFAGSQPASAQSSGRALALTDYYRIQSAGSPALSPDGRWVAFVRTSILESENRRHSEIWLVSADGSSPARRLTHPSFSSTNPRWSPDGALLAFSSTRKLPATAASSAESTVWFLRMDAPGGEAFQIPGVGGTPSFSPDNRWIAFTKRTPPPEKPAPALPESERLIQERFTGRIYDWMNFRYDGRGYLPDPRDPASSPPEELYVVSRAGGEPRQITRMGVDVEDVVWRPDSGALAFVANAHQRDEYVYERADLWTIALDGQATRLTDDGHNHSSPAWSPDGKLLAFRRAQGLNQVIQAKQSHGSAVDVYRMPAEGGQMENLTAAWDLLPGEPAWASDGRFIYFSGGIGGSTHLFRAAAPGGTVEQVTRGDRRLAGFSPSASFERIAYTATDPTHPADVFSARLDGSDERKLTGVNDDLLREVALSPAARVRYPSKDGTEIEGWVVSPRGYDPSRGSYPLVLSIHGGPHGAYGHDFSFPFQYLAANGYLVLYTNPRGSTGYGEKFLWATWGGWGLLDTEDVLAGVDYVQKHYAVDPKRLGVTGYSYGGFLTDWIITQTAQFAAAVSGAGISNWISDYGTADIPRTKESEFYGAPWEPKAGELLRKLSPITHAAGVRTPTLFVHGESDYRVPIEQAEQMYTALKKRRVPAKFIRYPDMSHGGWTPWNTVHRYHHELQWWNQYLGTRPTSTQ